MFPFSIGLTQDASTVDAVFNRVLPSARLQSAPTEGGFWHLRLSCPIAMPFQIIWEKYNIFHKICQPLLMKKENVSATFQGFRDFILRVSTRAGSRGKLHITANIILKILKILLLKILQILLLDILEILLPEPAVRTSSFVPQHAPAAEKTAHYSKHNPENLANLANPALELQNITECGKL